MNEIFAKYAEKGSQMDKQRAIYLLLQCYVDYCGVSPAMRTVVWDAAYAIFDKHEQEIPFETECFSNFEFLNKINPNYTEEVCEYDIAILRSYKEYFRTCMMVVDENDDETNSAVCYGISILEL